MGDTSTPRWGSASNRHLLRRPRWVRRSAAGFGMLWAGLLIGLKVSGAAASSWPTIVAGIVVAALVAWRSAVLGVDAKGDQLVVRNVFRTTTIDRREIDGLRVGRAPTMLFGGTGVIVATTGGRVVHLTITARVTRLIGSRRVDEDLATLRAWRAGR